MTTYYIFPGCWPLFSIEGSPSKPKVYAHMYDYTVLMKYHKPKDAIEINNLGMLMTDRFYDNFKEALDSNKHLVFIAAVKDCLEGLIAI